MLDNKHLIYDQHLIAKIYLVCVGFLGRYPTHKHVHPNIWEHIYFRTHIYFK